MIDPANADQVAQDPVARLLRLPIQKELERARLERDRELVNPEDLAEQGADRAFDEGALARARPWILLGGRSRIGSLAPSQADRAGEQDHGCEDHSTFRRLGTERVTAARTFSGVPDEAREVARPVLAGGPHRSHQDETEPGEQPCTRLGHHEHEARRAQHERGIDFE